MQKLLQWVKTNIQPVQILKNLWFLFKDTFTQWSQDKAARMSAGLAYYTTFSMAPLLLIVIFITGLVLGPAAAEGRIITEISSVVGNQAAQTIQEIIKNANRPFPGVIATIIGVLTMLYGASGMFAQIQDSLDTIWKVPIKENPKPFDFLRTRSVSFLMVVASGVLLLSMVMFSTVQATIAKYFSQYIPTTESFWELNNFLFTFLIITFLFAAVFKIIPRIRIQWRDVWIGAAFTALLFNGSKVLISLYLGNSSIISTYGAASSLVVIMLWVYYSAQIFLFGAEFTQVYTRRYGSLRPIVEITPTIEASTEPVQPVMQEEAAAEIPVEMEESLSTKTTQPKKNNQTVKVVAAAVPVLAGITFAVWHFFFRSRNKK